MKIVKRIHIKHGRTKRTVVLMDGPIPDVGDLLTLSGKNWTVTRVKDEKCFAEFDTSGDTLRQVFP